MRIFLQNSPLPLFPCQAASIAPRYLPIKSNLSLCVPQPLPLLLCLFTPFCLLSVSFICLFVYLSLYISFCLSLHPILFCFLYVLSDSLCPSASSSPSLCLSTPFYLLSVYFICLSVSLSLFLSFSLSLHPLLYACCIFYLSLCVS